MAIRMILTCTFLTAGILIIPGCGQQTTPSPTGSQPEASAQDAAPDVTVTPEMAEALAKADALDGQDDKIVTRCASCALKMDGSNEHPLHVGEYTMYFCKEDCKQAFSEDIPASVLAMKLPPTDKTDTP